MRSVAERFRCTAAAAAEARLLDACDPVAGAGRDLEIAADLQRAVEQRLDVERTVARLERLAFALLGLAARLEIDVVVRVVAERLVLRGAATAERRTVVNALAVEANVAAYGV